MRAVLAGVDFEAEPIKGSRFLARVRPVTSSEEAMAALRDSEEEHPDATHHCWAFRLADGGVRCHDAGEPSGTAGRPILARLEGRDLVDVMVIVVHDYADGPAVDGVLEGLEVAVEYTDRVSRTLTVQEDGLPSLRQRLLDATAGRARLERT